MKTEHQIQFQQYCLTLDKQFQIIEKQKNRLTEDRLTSFNCHLKKLNAVLNKIESKLKSSLRVRNVDQYDIKDKIKRYKEQYDRRYEKYRGLQAQYLRNQRDQLAANRSQDPFNNNYSVQMDDLSRMKDHRDRLHNVHRQANETKQVMDNTYGQLKNHAQTLDRIKAENKQFEHELSITDQFMRVLTNRDLITKLILVLLIAFLGVSDIAILLLKFI